MRQLMTSLVLALSLSHWCSAQTYSGYTHADGKTFTPFVHLNAGAIATCTSAYAATPPGALSRGGVRATSDPDPAIAGCVITASQCGAKILRVDEHCVAAVAGAGFLYCQGQAPDGCTLTVSGTQPGRGPFPQGGNAPHQAPPDYHKIICNDIWHNGTDVFDSDGTNIVSGPELRKRLIDGFPDQRTDGYSRDAINALPDDALYDTTGNVIEDCQQGGLCGLDTSFDKLKNDMHWVCDTKGLYEDIKASLSTKQFELVRHSFNLAEQHSPNTMNVPHCYTGKQLQELFDTSCFPLPPKPKSTPQQDDAYRNSHGSRRVGPRGGTHTTGVISIQIFGNYMGEVLVDFCSAVTSDDSQTIVVDNGHASSAICWEPARHYSITRANKKVELDGPMKVSRDKFGNVKTLVFSVKN